MKPGALFLFAAFALHQPATDWHLVWSDEFNGPAGTAPDASKWTYDLGGSGWGNHELETYTSDRASAAEDGKGHLVIRAARNAAGYTSARIKTEGKFSVRYGKIGARIEIPRGQGIWPAFWMLGNDIAKVGWPACGEIDIMENIGKEPAIVHGTVHGPGYSGANGISSADTLGQGKALADSFHEYAIEWSPDSITFFLDNHPYGTVTPASLPAGAHWVYDRPMFLLLNLAVGGGWPGNPDASTRFPQTLVVDWIRVWQRPE